MRNALLANFVAVLISFAMCGCQEDTAPASPLTGSRSHSFGELPYGGGKIELEHTFRLTNNTSAKLIVLGTKASCGCTKASLSSMTIPPGQQLDVATTLTLATSGRRTEWVWIALEGHEPIILEVSASARRKLEVYAAQKSILLLPGEPRRIALISTKADDDLPPPEPQLSKVPAVYAKFEGWHRVLNSDSESGRSARWQGNILVSTSNSLTTESALQIGISEADNVSIDLVGRPWAHVR